MADRIYSAEELLALAVKFKATRIKAGPMEIELHSSAFEPVNAPSPESDASALPEDFQRIPTPEEFLFAAGIQLETTDGLTDPEPV